MKKGTIHKLFNHFFNNHTDEVVSAICEFFEINRFDAKLEFEDETEEGLFMEWITFDYRLRNGRKLIKDFIVENPNKLSREELNIYEDLQMNKYGMFEILKVKRDEYIELESLQSGKIYRVIEKSATHNAKTKTIWFCRVGKVGDHWELVGSNPIIYPFYCTERMKAVLHRDNSQTSPKDTYKTLNNQSDQPSEMENSLTMTPEEIESKKDKIKRQLAKQISITKNETSVNEILDIIYSENGRPGDITMKIAALLTGTSSVPSQRIIDLVSDAWNYFPHKFLNGMSPAEKAKEVYGDKKQKDFSGTGQMDIISKNESGLPAGAFLPLSVISPKLEKETKTITFSESKYGLDPGTYRLAENYCADRNCDCRKVMLNLIDDENKILATIGFGWEGVKYYEKWLEDKVLAKQMVGAYLETGGIQTTHSKECLRFVEKTLKANPLYVNCLRRHYKQFKEAL